MYFMLSFKITIKCKEDAFFVLFQGRASPKHLHFLSLFGPPTLAFPIFCINSNSKKIYLHDYS